MAHKKQMFLLRSHHLLTLIIAVIHGTARIGKRVSMILLLNAWLSKAINLLYDSRSVTETFLRSPNSFFRTFFKA